MGTARYLEGWVVLITWLAVFMICVRFVVPRNPYAHWAFALAMIGLLLTICRIKGEPTQWRRGADR